MWQYAYGQHHRLRPYGKHHAIWHVPIVSEPTSGLSNIGCDGCTHTDALHPCDNSTLESWRTGKSHEYACTYQQRQVYVFLGRQHLYRQPQREHDDPREVKRWKGEKVRNNDYTSVGYGRWWRRLLPLLFTFSPFYLCTSTAQEMHIVEFKKLKKGPLNMKHVVSSKQEAILDLKTSEKGFSFLANGKQGIAAEEGEGLLTLKTPDKTTFIVVKHADYGQLTWKVPKKKGLRRKKHYTAALETFSPDKEYKLQEQWVIFEIQPQDAILTIDSTRTTIHNGRKQFYLPVGKHGWLAEAPFHQAEKDTVELTDEGRQIVKIALQPIYSYLTVKTALEGCDILVDGQLIGKTRGTSGHLREGTHHLFVKKDSLCYYDATFDIGWKEKKTIELTAEDLHIRDIHRPITTISAVAENDSVVQDTMTTIKAPVTIKALDDFTSIWVNRELKGFGSWEGELEAGFYLINTEKEGLESRSTALWVNDATPQHVELIAPKGSFGMLNIQSNEIGADVYINGRLTGTTPIVVKDLPAGSNCEVRLEKAGFFEAKEIVKVVGNDLTHVKMKLKKR